MVYEHGDFISANPDYTQQGKSITMSGPRLGAALDSLKKEIASLQDRTKTMRQALTPVILPERVPPRARVDEESPKPVGVAMFTNIVTDLQQTVSDIDEELKDLIESLNL